MGAWLEELWYPSGGERLSHKLARGPLLLASGAFRLAVAARNALYDRGLLRVHRVEGLQVVSVGNLHVGGTGKTPVVIYLARLLTKSGRKVAVLTRGYGRSSDGVLMLRSSAEMPPAPAAGDEPLLIARSCPGVTVLVGADRVALAEQALQLGAEVALLDDGMQHRRLARDLDIAVVDAQAGFGNGHVLPCGPLREAPSALRRAGLIWLRGGAGPGRPPSLPAGVPVVQARHQVRDLLSPEGGLLGRDVLRGAPVLALSGVARPRSFVQTLKALGMQVVEERLVPDHHPFTPAELDQVVLRARSAGLLIVTTEKDLMRLPAKFPAWVARLDVELTGGGEALARLLRVPRDNVTLGGRGAGIHDTTMIDRISFEEREVRLTMLDTDEWRRAPDRLQQLEAKLGNYASFALDGRLAQLYPESRGKAVRIQVELRREPEREVVRLLDVARERMEEMGLELVVQRSSQHS